MFGMKIQSDFRMQFVFLDRSIRQMGWMKMHIHSLTVDDAFRKAEIPWLLWDTKHYLILHFWHPLVTEKKVEPFRFSRFFSCYSLLLSKILVCINKIIVFVSKTKSWFMQQRLWTWDQKEILLVGQFPLQYDGKEITTPLQKKKKKSITLTACKY